MLNKHQTKHNVPLEARDSSGPLLIVPALTSHNLVTTPPKCGGPSVAGFLWYSISPWFPTGGSEHGPRRCEVCPAEGPGPEARADGPGLQGSQRGALRRGGLDPGLQRLPPPHAAVPPGPAALRPRVPVGRGPGGEQRPAGGAEAGQGLPHHLHAAGAVPGLPAAVPGGEQ